MPPNRATKASEEYTNLQKKLVQPVTPSYDEQEAEDFQGPLTSAKEVATAA